VVLRENGFWVTKEDLVLLDIIGQNLLRRVLPFILFSFVAATL